MGMDLYGKKPKSPEGEYFRANIWSWRPIDALMLELGLIDKELYQKMSFNDGYGPDEAQAQDIAAGIERFLKMGVGTKNVQKAGELFTAELGVRFRRDNKKMIFQEDPAYEQTEGDSPYVVSREHLEEFVKFCYASGGFNVN